MVVILLAGCGRRGGNGITCAGSTSVEPFAERLAELYMVAHPDREVSVQGGGSSAGVRAIQNRICQIGMSSRELHDDERGITELPIALDAIALIVHRDNPVRGLSLEQARAVFSGRVRNWRELGGPDRRITVITREEGSGTRASFEEKVMTPRAPKGAKPAAQPFAADALVQDSNGAVREIVATDPDAIGYISLGLVDERVVALAVNRVAPTEAAVHSGRYPVVRRFLFLTSGETDSATDAFVAYVLGPEGQQALAEEGLIRVR
jgi:phosphate transport system substrate-binding protein